MVKAIWQTKLTNDTDLKRELISRQVHKEIQELNSPTALQRFGAPFRSEYGEVSPVDSELPILRYIFVNHVRKFPFLNLAKEKEFWQDKLQVVGMQDARVIGRLRLILSTHSSWSRSPQSTYLPPKTDWRRPSVENWPRNVKSWSS